MLLLHPTPQLCSAIQHALLSLTAQQDQQDFLFRLRKHPPTVDTLVPLDLVEELSKRMLSWERQHSWQNGMLSYRLTTL